jgi:CRISPR-associated protein Csb1
MSELSGMLDEWANGAAAALVLGQPLRPVVGTLVFPPTFAPVRRGEPSDYVIDEIDGRGVVTLDTPGAQANRLEPLFMQDPLATLVPQITIRVGNQQKNLLELGHRAADALARSTDANTRIHEAFEQALVGDHSALAAFAPTSLVFGAWDSRDTGAKLPRLLESRIDAYGVQKRERAAQYFAALDYVEAELLDPSTQKKELDQRSQAGFRDSPSGRGPGGVELVEGGRIVRTITIHLSALHRLGAGANKDRGANLRLYTLGLSLAVATAPLPLFLRQGCSLVPSKEEARPKWTAVNFDGSEKAVDLSHKEVLAYAKAARDHFFPNGIKADTWNATKSLAQAEVKKRAKGVDDAAATRAD